MTVGAERLVYSRRATVGTATEISQDLAALLASLGERNCLECGASMERGREWVCPKCGKHAPLAAPRHFASSTYAAACLKCHGVGTLQVPNPGKVILHPELPLTDGAMYSPGFFPNGYLGKPFNGGYYLVLALAARYGFDPQTTAWNDISTEAQQAFLFGTQELLTVHSKPAPDAPARTSQNSPAFTASSGIGMWAARTPIRSLARRAAGPRLRPEYLAVTLGDTTSSPLTMSRPWLPVTASTRRPPPGTTSPLKPNRLSFSAPRSS